ncbi:MAG: DUF4190 domain-containing protein [Arenimonas sp.]|uniref:DUF4190 domain-containing protein n=1 Tax=Arenimonas sp. TaxID=1872635 RepID=UPI0025C5FA8A|nr:DUF4190 domain-containing protein [Arenimonas sp.]MBW8367296.1 DUF4190 domain-containing protein [Arenimonas sp.]
MPPTPTPPPFQAPPSAPVYPVRQTSGLAITSLVLGLLGWTLLPFLGSVGAVVCGHMARAEIRRQAATMDGDGLAIAGLVLGWSAIGITILSVLAIVLFFGGLAVLLAALGISGQL